MFYIDEPDDDTGLEGLWLPGSSAPRRGDGGGGGLGGGAVHLGSLDDDEARELEDASGWRPRAGDDDRDWRQAVAEPRDGAGRAGEGAGRPSRW